MEANRNNKFEEIAMQKREGVIWNILSSLVTAASSVLLLMVIKRFVGIELGAYFSVAVAVANVMINIGHLNSFGYQISDVVEKYSFKTYLSLRKFTICVMLIVTLIYISFQKYVFQKSLIIFCYCVYRAVYAYADVYQGRYQQKGRVDLAAKLQFFKVLIPDVVLAFAVIFFQNLEIAISLSTLTEILYLIIYNKKNQIFFEDNLSVNLYLCKDLFRQCLPLFFSAFTTTYILNSSKYAIDKLLTNDVQVYYSILLLPATTVHLIAGFVYRPFLTEYAEDWSLREYNRLKQKIRRVFIVILVGIIFIEVISKKILLPFLKWLYVASELENYQWEFKIILLAGGINAIVIFLGFLITIMRMQENMLWIYSFTFIIALFLPQILIKQYNFMGAAISFLVLSGVQFLMMTIVYLKGMYFNIRKI